MLTITMILILAAIVLAIAAAAGKWGPLALPVAVILLALVTALQYLPK
jgi:hypothetical protein